MQLFNYIQFILQFNVHYILTDLFVAERYLFSHTTRHNNHTVFISSRSVLNDYRNWTDSLVNMNLHL